MVCVLFTVKFFTFYLVEQYLHWQPNAPVIPIVVMGLGRVWWFRLRRFRGAVR
jgi:hypothetical protein